MPRMNGTGPAGQGPLTGRRQGLCGIPGLNRSQATLQQSSNWFGRLLQGVLGGFGLGTYGARRGSGRSRGGFRGQGQGGR